MSETQTPPLRAVRGGSSNYTPYGLRSAFRSRLGPTLRSWNYGVRLVARPAEVPLPPLRVVRGGSFRSFPDWLCSANRSRDWPTSRLGGNGARLVARAAP